MPSRATLRSAGKSPPICRSACIGPLISFNFSGVPTSTSWLAANVVYHTLYPHEAALPPIVVDDGAAPIGDGSPRRLIWQLLMDDFVQGTRGSAAREDQGLARLYVADRVAGRAADHPADR